MTTSYVDPVFPFPEPSWLWVYDLIVRDQGASVALGEMRKWSWTGSTSRTVKGYIAAADPRTVDRAASRGVVVDAVALIPNGIAVSEEDVVEVAADSGAPTIFVGQYAINSVRPNASHQRLLLTRFRGEVPAHAG